MNQKIITRKQALKQSFILWASFSTLGGLDFILESCHSKSIKINFNKITSLQEKTIGEIAEVIIPRTDTPGALDLDLGKFIIMMVKDIFDFPLQNSFFGGLEIFMDNAKDTFGKDFIFLEPDQKIKIIANEEDYAFNLISSIKKRILKQPPTFYQILKELTVFGFCTSEKGSKEQLAFLPVPGGYSACQTLKPNQKAWAISN